MQISIVEDMCFENFHCSAVTSKENYLHHLTENAILKQLFEATCSLNTVLLGNTQELHTQDPSIIEPST